MRASGSGAPRDSAEESYYELSDRLLSSGSSKKTEHPSVLSTESWKRSFGPGITQAATTGATEPGNDTALPRFSLPGTETLKKQMVTEMKQFEEECAPGRAKPTQGVKAVKTSSKRVTNELKNLLLQGLQRGTERKEDSRPKMRNDQREESGGRKKRDEMLEEVKRSCQPKAKKKVAPKKSTVDRTAVASKKSKRHASEENDEKQSKKAQLLLEYQT